MTLHEAIEFILTEYGRPMTSREIADEVNNKKLYKRKDGKPIPPSQISARASNYENIFIKHLGKIKLLKDDFETMKFHKYRNEINSKLRDYPHFSSINKKHSILQNSLNEILLDFKNDNFYSYNIFEPKSTYGSNNAKRYETVYKLCDWFIKEAYKNEPVFSEYFLKILSGLSWFSKGNHKLITKLNFGHHLVLKIAGDNHKSNFKVKIQNHLNDNRENTLVNSISRDIERIINDNRNTTNDSKIIRTKIYCPPFNRHHGRNLTVFDDIINHLTSFENNLDKAILIVNSASLSSLRNPEVQARKRIIESGHLESVIEFSTKMIEKMNVNISVLIFDFSKNFSKTFFYYDTNNSNESKIISHLINEKSNVKDISKLVYNSQLDTVDYSLSPAKYIVLTDFLPKKSGYQKYKLIDLITESKIGRSVNRKLLYPGGELKVLRVSDLEKNSIYYESKENMLGLDSDEASHFNLKYVRGGIAISSFNKELKIGILPPKKTFILGANIYWINPNSSLVINEFLAKELKKDYVSRQVKYLSRGSTIPRLYSKDLLNLQLQIPTVEEQSKKLIENLNQGVFQNKSDDPNELDFVRTLKHSLKQPAASLGNDFSSLKRYLLKKTSNKEGLNIDESIVPIFENDTKEQIEVHSLDSTLKRMERAISDIDYVLDKAVQVISISEPIKEEIILKDLFENISNEYPGVNFKITGPKDSILADRKQLRILTHNFIDNAIKHGFEDSATKPKIWLEIIPKDAITIQISIRNNGKPLPPQFSVEDFLAKGKSSKQDVGSGFGGFLIGRILNKHNGTIELKNYSTSNIKEYNVEFLITLPK